MTLYSFVGLIGAVLCMVLPGHCQPAPAGDSILVGPWQRDSFEANEGCMWMSDSPAARGLRMNAHYIAPPGPGEDWQRWLDKLREYRRWTREHMWDITGSFIRMRFDGVRAWVRAGRRWALAADLQPGESVALQGEARWVEGQSELCMAFDWCDRTEGASGAWRGWSTVRQNAQIGQDGQWHEFRLEATVPTFDTEKTWARPILGMDATHDATRGTVELRNIRMSVPKNRPRVRKWRDLQVQAQRPFAFDDSIYDRPDLTWTRSNFVCGFVLIYDRAFWDPERGRYRVAELIQDAKRQFGGWDSVVLWAAYPRIGVDDRNQFDFFRHMPGGLEGVRRVVEAFHAGYVKVFLPYKPWDRGTRREGVSDEEALAAMLGATGADGVFLDTMVQAPAQLRQMADTASPGVAFEPEGHPRASEMERCSGSWAQGLRPFEGVGALRLKWIEQRHMQHQVLRWDRSHRAELAAAWVNGSGMLVWENIFGTWNPWCAEDRACLRRMTPVQRLFCELLSTGQWLPCHPTLTPGIVSGCWASEGMRLWTLANMDDAPVDGPMLQVSHDGQRFFDLWDGRELPVKPVDGKMRISLRVDRLGAVAAFDPSAIPEGLPDLLRRQADDAARPEPTRDAHAEALPVLEPQAPPQVTPGREPIATLRPVKAGEQEFFVRHVRRECGCYPDPGTPPQQWHDFLRGYPYDGMMEHRFRKELPAYRIAPRVVTNRQFQAFMKATGYAPACRDRFLEHWQGHTCPEALADGPVVYVDLIDARAYARWAGARLPTEWEWHRAAQQLGEGFTRGEVWEWTESERDDGHTRFVMLRGGSQYRALGSVWYMPGGEQPIETHAKFLLMYPGLDRCATIGFRCMAPGATS